MGTRVDIVRAIEEGRQAGREGAPSSSCPYPATTLLRTAWIRGHVETAPPIEQPDGEE
jgi:ribosome modulation factor